MTSQSVACQKKTCFKALKDYPFYFFPTGILSENATMQEVICLFRGLKYADWLNSYFFILLNGILKSSLLGLKN